jgi:hypothetical protein
MAVIVSEGAGFSANPADPEIVPVKAGLEVVVHDLPPSVERSIVRPPDTRHLMSGSFGDTDSTGGVSSFLVADRNAPPPRPDGDSAG